MVRSTEMLLIKDGSSDKYRVESVLSMQKIVFAQMKLNLISSAGAVFYSGEIIINLVLCSSSEKMQTI